MDSIEKLRDLKSKMNEVLNHLNHVNENLTKIKKSNASAINVNSVAYKDDKLTRTKNQLVEQIRTISQKILPSLEREIRELESLES